MYEGLDTVVLYEELAYEDVLPVAWKQDARAVRSGAHRQLRGPQPARTAGAVRARRARPAREARRELAARRGHHAARSEGQPAARHGRCSCWSPAGRGRVPPRSASMRWAACGRPLLRSPSWAIRACWKSICATASPSRCASSVASRRSVRTDASRCASSALSENIADLLEKLAFRKHRRQVAGIRAPKK